MFGHTSFRLFCISVDDCLNKPMMLFINLSGRIILFHNVVSRPGNNILRKLIRCRKDTVNHRVICDLCNLLVKFAIQFPPYLFIFCGVHRARIIYNSAAFSGVHFLAARIADSLSSATRNCWFWRRYSLFNLRKSIIETQEKSELLENVFSSIWLWISNYFKIKKH